MRSEKTTASYDAFVNFVCIMILVNSVQRALSTMRKIIFPSFFPRTTNRLQPRRRTRGPYGSPDTNIQATLELAQGERPKHSPQQPAPVLRARSNVCYLELLGSRSTTGPGRERSSKWAGGIRSFRA